MAKVKRNMIIAGVSGSLGEEYYARITRDGRTIISRKPDFRNRQFSQAQIDVQTRTKQAAAYAKAAAKENPVYARKAAGTSRNAYNLAFKDWQNPPVIRSMDLCHEGFLRVSATDDMQVTKVLVTVLDREGESLEQGEAECVMGVWWDYRPANRGRIRVEAWDLAGNVKRREFDDPWKFTPFGREIN